MSWQRIELAPSGGRMILAWNECNRCCYIVSQWRPEDPWDGWPEDYPPLKLGQPLPEPPK